MTKPAESDASSPAELDLLAALRAGAPEAYEMVVRRHGPRLLIVARRILKCEQDSADAVQEAFISAFQAIHQFGGGANLCTWLHRIVVNACLMKLRSRVRQCVVSIEDLCPRFDETGHQIVPAAAWVREPVNELIDAETRSFVRSAIDRLPDDYRTVLLLRDIEELDTDETALMLGVSPGVVKTRLHRARQALRTLLAPRFQ
jgi:RNA polymerase sigma-70 factor (ECF subfamily)